MSIIISGSELHLSQPTIRETIEAVLSSEHKSWTHHGACTYPITIIPFVSCNPPHCTMSRFGYVASVPIILSKYCKCTVLRWSPGYPIVSTALQRHHLPPRHTHTSPRLSHVFRPLPTQYSALRSCCCWQARPRTRSPSSPCLQRGKHLGLGGSCQRQMRRKRARRLESQRCRQLLRRGTESAAPGAAAIRATTVEATKRSFMLGDSVLCVSFMNAEIGLLGTVNCKRNRFVPFWVIIFYPPKKLRVKVR
mmetsp:Transcript_4235/g.5953  ORF Transcript_4235/g.5953 Transcript_4235/m.5953 type:complete len:250 (-) Transcript_4235:38-787(-)